MIPLVLLVVGLALMATSVVRIVRATAHRRRPWRPRATKWTAWGATVWTLAVGAAFLLVPVYTTSTSSGAMSPSVSSAVASRPEVVTTTSSSTLLEHEGSGIIAVLLVPIGVALAGSLGGGPNARRHRLVAGWVLLGLWALGMMSIGVFYLPAAIAMLVAGAKTPGPAVGGAPSGDPDPAT